MQYTISELDPAEARDAALAHCVMQAATYATYASAGFTAMALGSVDRRTEAITGYDVVRIAKNAGGNIVGIGLVGTGPEWWERPDDDDFVPPAVYRYLSALFTMPGTHGSGLGKAMLEQLLPDGEAAYLWCMEANTRAIAFYEKFGFELDGYRKTTTGWGDMDMVRMVRLNP